MGTHTVTQGLCYDAGLTMAVPEPNYKKLLHLIACKRYCEL